LPAIKSNEESPTEKFRADGMWALVQCLSAGQGIDPSLVASRQEIGEFCRALANGGVENADIRLLRTWRRDAVGATALKMIRQEARAEFYFDPRGLRGGAQ